MYVPIGRTTHTFWTKCYVLLISIQVKSLFCKYKLTKLFNKKLIKLFWEYFSFFICRFSTGTLSHPLNLMSVYVHGDVDSNRAEVTSKHTDWSTVDYIFYGYDFLWHLYFYLPVIHEVQRRRNDNIEIIII